MYTVYSSNGVYYNAKDLVLFRKLGLLNGDKIDDCINKNPLKICEYYRSIDVFNGMIDLTHIKWSFDKDSPGTAGMFLKARGIYNGSQYFLKMSSYNSVDKVYGYECAFEIVAQRVADLLGLRHLRYYLVKARVSVDGYEFITYVAVSKDYRVVNETRVSFELLYQSKSNVPSTVEFILSEFMQPYLHELLGMLVLDYIIYNRDRHSANIEFLYNTKTKQYRLAPLLDHGCCLTSVLFNNWSNETSGYYLSDKPVNNCIGSFSLLNNLQNICKGRVYFCGDTFIPNDLLSGLIPIFGSDYCNFILSMVRARWNNALEILNS